MGTKGERTEKEYQNISDMKKPAPELIPDTDILFITTFSVVPGGFSLVTSAGIDNSRVIGSDGMKSGRIFLIFLIMVFMSVSFLPVFAADVDDPGTSDMSADAGGVFEWITQLARRILPGSPSAEVPGAEDGGDEEGFFSRNPFVYVAAFWTEIVNAPKERTFFERIMYFLEAVKVRR